jgi:hypothetical protein
MFGDTLVGPDEVARALAVDVGELCDGDRRLLDEVPYAPATLEAARARGELLVLRVPRDAEAPLTILRLDERLPGLLADSLMKGVGYLLKDEWTLDREPFAATATCRLEWRLVHRAPVPTTCNLGYEPQDAALARYAATLGLAGTLRRRSVVEIAYDCALFDRTRGVRLLEREWDWSDTPTADGGFATVGAFGDGGLHVLGYSRAVRFGTLGVCPQH